MVSMFEVRFHGRGGQGAVMAAQTLAEAAVLEGYHAQAFPLLRRGEARGAGEGVRPHRRQKITIKSQIYEPDMLVLLDEYLPEIDPVGRRAEAWRARRSINTTLARRRYDLGVAVDCATVDATTIALEKLKAPIVNTAMLGAMAKAQDLVSLDAIVRPSGQVRGAAGRGAADLNAEAAKVAFEQTTVGTCKGNREIAQRKKWLPDLGGDAHRARPSESRAGERVGPGSSWQNLTGTWRTSPPHYMKEKCIRCLRCWWSCPEGRSSARRTTTCEWDLPLLQGLRHLRRDLPGERHRDGPGGARMVTKVDLGGPRRRLGRPAGQGGGRPRVPDHPADAHHGADLRVHQRRRVRRRFHSGGERAQRDVRRGRAPAPAGSAPSPPPRRRASR